VDLENEGVRTPLKCYTPHKCCLSDCVSDCLSDNAPINFGAPNIKPPCLLSYPRQSLRQHQWDSNTRYRDSPHFQDLQGRGNIAGPISPNLPKFFGKKPTQFGKKTSCDIGPQYKGGAQYRRNFLAKNFRRYRAPPWLRFIIIFTVHERRESLDPRYRDQLGR
jgi:hypothetical protein